MRAVILVILCVIALMVPRANAHENEVEINRVDDQVCIASNGAPNHAIGRFPNRGNPNSFRAQPLSYCFDATPSLSGTIDDRATTVGVTLTGIPMRPFTAGYYDASNPRGVSNDPASGWRVEGMHNARRLGMDSENAHVDLRGLYHYHSMSPSYLASLQGTLIGFAADGFEIHYNPEQAVSSWVLRSGTRSTPPFGRFDGTYEEDWVYQAGAGTLDECNGAMANGTYTYYATDSYPFFPRCMKGTVGTDFLPRR